MEETRKVFNMFSENPKRPFVRPRVGEKIILKWVLKWI
jgi:hypothetical protein